MLSYLFVLKHDPLSSLEIFLDRSGVESQVREPVNLEKLWLVMSDMTRLTKLILPAYLPKDSNFITGNRLFGLWTSNRCHRVPQVTGPRCSYQLIYWEQRSKSVSGTLRTLGTPTVLKHQGCGGPVRGLGTRCFSSNSNITALTVGSASVRLKELMKLNENDLRYVNNGLIHIVSDPEVK